MKTITSISPMLVFNDKGDTLSLKSILDQQLQINILIFISSFIMKLLSSKLSKIILKNKEKDFKAQTKDILNLCLKGYNSPKHLKPKILNM